MIVLASVRHGLVRGGDLSEIEFLFGSSQCKARAYRSPNLPSYATQSRLNTRARVRVPRVQPERAEQESISQDSNRTFHTAHYRQINEFVASVIAR